MQDCCYTGRGKVYFTRPLSQTGSVDGAGWGAAWGQSWGGQNAGWNGNSLVMPSGEFIGMCKQLRITHGKESLGESIDWANNADDCATDVVTSANVDLVMLCHNAKNLATVLGASNSIQNSIPQTITFTLPAYVNADTGFYFDFKANGALAYTVTPSWTPTSWIENVDYFKGAFGVTLLKGLPVPAGGFLTVTVTPDSQAVRSEALQRDSATVGLVFEGINKHNSKPLLANFYRVKFSLTDSFDFINEQTHEITLRGRLQKIQPLPNVGRWYSLIY